MKVINACKPPPREMKKCSLSKCPFSAFLRNAFATVQFTAWAKNSDACHIFGGKKKKSSFSEERTKQHIPYPLGFDSVFVWHYCIYHTWKLSTSAGFCALELQVRELGLNPVKVLRYLFHFRHRSLHILQLQNWWLVAIHTAVIIKIKMIFSSSRHRPNSYYSCTASHPRRRFCSITSHDDLIPGKGITTWWWGISVRPFHWISFPLSSPFPVWQRKMVLQPWEGHSVQNMLQFDWTVQMVNQ